MAKLVVNPNSTAPWEIELKPGPNFLGRGFANDFKIDDPSVSGSHCQILVDQGNIFIKDLGSTNGTFVNRAPVREANLTPGQTIHLGGVELFFPPDGPAVSAPRIGIARTQNAPPLVAAPPPTAPPIPAPAAPAVPGSQNCKFHPKTPGRYYCNKCVRFFCELCVTSRGQHKYCRHCGAECVPVQVQLARPAQEKGFFRRLPGAFVYPFRGFGVVMLILVAFLIAGQDFLRFGIFAWVLKIALYGLIFLFMQNIIHTTASDENEPLGFPNAGDLFGAAFQLGATILVSFAPVIAMVVARLFDVEVPGSAIMAAALLCCLYFPMAFLAVAMKDTVLAANPLVVIPAIFKMPLEYMVAAAILMAVFGFRFLGDAISGVAGAVTMSTKDMSVLFVAMAIKVGWALISAYLLTVNMRILGLLYISKKQQFGWFSR
jgi:hypothetical protein